MPNERKIFRCAVYTRKSSERGLEQDFNSLDAQREAAEAYIKSQAHEGWKLLKTAYDDGGISGGTLERQALQSLLADIRERKIDVVVVYKIDRLTRSLADFAKLVELFDQYGVSFVSVTQQFNTTTSMGRLTLNVLLSFAQFEREVAGERIRDKFAASRRKGMWMGGSIPIGYEVKNRKLVVDATEAETVRVIFQRYLSLGCVSGLSEDLDQIGVRSKQGILKSGRVLGGASFGRGALYHLLQNRIYRGEVVHKGTAYPGEHEAIVDEELWNAVQALLSGNRTTRRQSRIASGAPLAGLVFDDQGNRMSPTYAVRRGSRYRYYVSQAILQNRKQEAGTRPRVSADDLERVVFEALPREVSGRGTGLGLDSRIWSDDSRDRIRGLVDKIVVNDREIAITLKTTTADIPETSVDRDDESRSRVLIKAPLPTPRRERREILLPRKGLPPRGVDQALVLALARARSWTRALRRGEYTDPAEIAHRFDLSDAHVRRILRLAFLSPDIVEAIVEGHQPRMLSVTMLLRSIPLSWADQRAVLGFAR